MDAHCEMPRWQLLKSSLVNLDPVAFKEMLEGREGVVLIDVRTSEEVQTYRLEGSLHLDYLGPGFLDALEDLDREATYLLYCRSGRRSVRTGVLMKNWGFNHVINLDGGLAAWKEVFTELAGAPQ